MKSSTKGINTINLENMEYFIIKARAKFWSVIRGCVTQSQCFHYTLLQTHWVPFQTKNGVCASTALTNSCTKAIKCVPQIIAYVVEWKEEWDIKENKGKPWFSWYKQWSNCGRQKGTSWHEVLNSKEVKPAALAIVMLCLSRGMYWTVTCRSTQNSVK